MYPYTSLAASSTAANLVKGRVFLSFFDVNPCVSSASLFVFLLPFLSTRGLVFQENDADSNAQDRYGYSPLMRLAMAERDVRTWDTDKKGERTYVRITGV